MNTIPIFFTVDESYAPYLDCAIRSIVDNASPNYEYKIIVLQEKMTEQSIERVKTAVKPPFSIEFVSMEKSYEGLTDRKENRLRCDYFTMTIYFRIFIADMFPQYDKGIYIDSDIIVPGDISEMYEIDLEGNLLGACPDYSIIGIPELDAYVEDAIGVPPGKYVNSGVLLMDLKKLRELKFADKFLTLLNKYHFDCVAPDQDYINAMCKGKILFLDECWDAMPPQGDDKEEMENPKLIHFNLFAKPWCYDNIHYADYFWKYARQSPFYEDIVKFKAEYSKEQMDSDASCLANLIATGGVMGEREVTFRKMHESGESIRV